VISWLSGSSGSTTSRTARAYNLFFVRPHIGLDAEEAVVFNPRDEHHFTSHALDILQYDGEQLDLRRGDRL